MMASIITNTILNPTASLTPIFMFLKSFIAVSRLVLLFAIHRFTNSSAFSMVSAFSRRLLFGLLTAER
jgi:hypothetical protein